MEKVLEAGSVHDPEHKLKVGAVAELHAEGFNRDEIVDRFRGMEDFDERKTIEQVDHALKRDYHPFKCKTIRELGGCLEDSCRIYRKRRGLMP
jgi:DNA primase large subunit